MDPETVWARPPARLALTDAVVHVWRAALDLPAERIEQLWPLLSADEVARAMRFHFPLDRQRFVVGRGLLRLILSRYLLQAPDTLRFDYTAYGKPVLGSATGGPPLSFNVSHSEGLALYALTRTRALGVDLERVRPVDEYEQIAARFFSAGEYTRLCALPVEQRITAFFRCWTRKEAYIKAHGAGLSVPLDRFAVSLGPGEPAQLLYTLDDAAESSRWSLHSLAAGPEYQAALAVGGPDCQLFCWQWQEQAAYAPTVEISIRPQPGTYGPKEDPRP